MGERWIFYIVGGGIWFKWTQCSSPGLRRTPLMVGSLIITLHVGLPQTQHHLFGWWTTKLVCDDRDHSKQHTELIHLIRTRELTELFNGQTFDHCPSIWATVVQITLFLFPSKCKWTGIEESGNHCHLLSAHYCNHRVFVLVVREMHCPTRSSMNFKKASDGPGRDGNSGYLYICHKSNRSLGAFGDGVSDQMYNESFFFVLMRQRQV